MPSTTSPLWIKEQYQNTTLSMKVKEVLYRKQSAYQLVEVVDTDDWGKVMQLDGCMMVSERDEFFYHEGIAHLAMSLHHNPQRVLVLGGGDGGTLREVAKYPQPEQIDLVEIDGLVIEAAKLHIPLTAAGFADERVTEHVIDAFEYLKDIKSSDLKYDVIICDGSDPVGFAEVLIQDSFYALINDVLADGGFFITQSGSPLSQPDELIKTHKNIKQVFAEVICVPWLVPTYPGAAWSYMLASKSPLPASRQNPHQPQNTKVWSDACLPYMLSRPAYIYDLFLA